MGIRSRGSAVPRACVSAWGWGFRIPSTKRPGEGTGKMARFDPEPKVVLYSCSITGGGTALSVHLTCSDLVPTS